MGEREGGKVGEREGGRVRVKEGGREGGRKENGVCVCVHTHQLSISQASSCPLGIFSPHAQA